MFEELFRVERKIEQTNIAEAYSKSAKRDCVSPKNHLPIALSSLHTHYRITVRARNVLRCKIGVPMNDIGMYSSFQAFMN